ncbi:hypothetical protein BSL78_21280 [Apostichopus japonicus]|uniref:Uncharacterized protein n=1 Tax=Stichopus japonicus TaxID=307972 RepID=A0A2G8K1M8_STIJA|nr:hypothetical protein BSL78_21280 [Apostichopus japonicus]
MMMMMMMIDDDDDDDDRNDDHDHVDHGHYDDDHEDDDHDHVYLIYAIQDNCLDGSRNAPIFEDENINSLMNMSKEIDANRQDWMATKIFKAAVMIVGGLIVTPFAYRLGSWLFSAGMAENSRAWQEVFSLTESKDFSMHKFVRDNQESKTLPTSASKFVTIREKLAKIAIAINRVLVNVNVLRTSQMWGKVQEQDTSIRRSVSNELTQLWQLIQRKTTPSDPEAAIDSVLSKAIKLLKVFEYIIEESNITDPRLHSRITEDIKPSSENLNSALQNLCESGFQEGMNIGKLLLAFFTEQFDDLFKDANLEEIRNTVYPTIASAVNGSSGAVIRPTVDVNGVDEIDGGVQISDDVASAGASMAANTAVKVSRGILGVGIVFASLGTVTKTHSEISHAMELSNSTNGERVYLEKQFFELAVIMAITNTIVSSPRE